MSNFANIIQQFNDEESKSESSKVKNTETFKPDWEAADMRVMFEMGSCPSIQVESKLEMWL